MAQNPSKPRKANHFVREWRKKRGITQEELAEQIGQTSGAISQLENGIINYTQPTLEAIASALKCRPGDLLSSPPPGDETPATPEAQLRAALLAFGVDPRTLSRAIAVIKSGFTKAAEGTPEQNLPDDLSEPANLHRELTPSR